MTLFLAQRSKKKRSSYFDVRKTTLYREEYDDANQILNLLIGPFLKFKIVLLVGPV